MRFQRNLLGSADSKKVDIGIPSFPDVDTRSTRAPPTQESIMDTSNVLKMIRPFDPLSADAEDRYDKVALQLNRIRARRSRLDRQRALLEGEFIENDVTIQSGPRRGEPLSKIGRRRRLDRLVQISMERCRLDEQERFSVATLDRMNEALDRWARETYAPSS